MDVLSKRLMIEYRGVEYYPTGFVIEFANKQWHKGFSVGWWSAIVLPLIVMCAYNYFMR